MRSQKMLKMVADGHSFRIISALTSGPASIGQLSTSLGIPRTLCYRRVKAMETEGFIYREPEENTGGKAEIAYNTFISAVELLFTPASVSIAVRNRDRTGEGYVLDPKDDQKPFRTMGTEELELFLGEVRMDGIRPR